MLTIRKNLLSLNYRKFSRFLLAFFSISGCILGIVTARTADTYFLSLMLQAMCLPVSIVDLLFALLFPFVMTTVISYISKPMLLLPLCFLKSLFYGYLLCSVCMLFTAGGWLIGGMFLFSDSVSLVLLLFYSLRYLNGFQNSCGRCIIISTLIVSLTALLDVCVVSPYLSAIIKS